MVNNYDWTKDFSFLHFLRDVGKHITVNYMIAKDSVKNRMNSGSGISFTEFSYQLVPMTFAGFLNTRTSGSRWGGQTNGVT